MTEQIFTGKGGTKNYSENIPVPTPELFRCTGSVIGVRGPLVLVRLPLAAIGAGITIHTNSGAALRGTVVAFNDDTVSVAPFGTLTGICPGNIVSSSGVPPLVSVPVDHLGSLLDPFGQILNRTSVSTEYLRLSPYASPPQPLDRSTHVAQLITGIRSIDGFHPIAYGQRLAVAAPAGTGKSTLVGMLAGAADADVVVVGLIGERGREVREFLDLTMGAETMRRAIVVCSTSDQPAQLRALAALTAQAIAEHHRDRGHRVLLVIDSLTRLARAWREVGLASGELPVRHGYPPSVFEQLPRFLERAGNGAHGSITALYTLLQDGPAEHDPLLHEIQSILDGHLRLNADIAGQGIRPAIDIASSLSRFTHRLLPAKEAASRQRLIHLFDRLQSDRDLLLLGGTPDRELSLALHLETQIKDFLNQTVGTRIPIEETNRQLAAMIEEIANFAPM